MKKVFLKIKGLKINAEIDKIMDDLNNAQRK